ncbi:CLUMA_CG009425, isoform A [Clunio marinus]|uniref:CLUMA_CG009425, isoform A n=1 Tax=Clunio marinus TaxID=568069 RepID=A0A1J1I6U9_9DIPT|nr:CLUMA_CG009425, isoform A [Clunio marinus]
MQKDSGKYDKEFHELETKWNSFKRKLKEIAPEAFERKNNVFTHMISDGRTSRDFVKMAQGTRPILSKEIYDLMENFMEYMKNLPGQEGENYKVIYKDFKAPQLIKRLIMKRPLVFIGANDYNVLRINQPKSQSGKVTWQKIAKNLDKYDEDSPYLREYISYDENLLSSLVSMSTPTYFVSDGSGFQSSENFIPQGILCGLVGARLEKENFMEHRFLFPRDSNNLKFDSGVHQSDLFWIINVYPEAFPEGKIPALSDIYKKQNIYDGIYVKGINVKYLKKRLSFSVIPLIEEGVARGIEYKSKVVVSVPPIGAGVWKGGAPEATICNLIVTAVLDYLDCTFEPKKLEYLCAIYLPVVDMKIYSCYSNKNQIFSIEVNRKDSSIKINFKGVTDKQLTIFNQFRYVAQLLPEEFKSCLIVAGYAWDGNSYPGNEYWIDGLASFDPQAILCSNLGLEKYDEEFHELETKWNSFKSKLKEIAPKVFKREKNVFTHMISDGRTKRDFVKMAQGTRPFLAREVFILMERFMKFMMELPGREGKNYREIYKDMKAPDLVKRLLFKRPIVFFMKDDRTVMRSTPFKLETVANMWKFVAATLEDKGDNFPYLREYLSYDEILLSSLISMSTPTYFVSDGSLGKPFQTSDDFISQGILCGLVGARLEKENFMEHRFLFPRDSNNLKFDSGVHQADLFWILNVYPEAFPEGKIPALSDVYKKQNIYDGIYVKGINVKYLKKRLSFSVIPLIEEGVARGIEYKSKVVVSVPPIGAGVWKGTVPEATICNLIVTAVLDYLDSTFDPKKLEYLCAIYLPVVDMKIYSCYSNKNQISSIEVNRKDSSIQINFKGIADKQLTIFNQFRYVAQLLPEEFKSCLIVAAYAWDGNSYPGNEYWIDYLTSFDPQAILCSNLGQFQNPEVNTKLADAHRIKTY